MFFLLVLRISAQDQPKQQPQSTPPVQPVQQVQSNQNLTGEQQGRKRVYDIGLTFSGFTSFGVNFKTGSEKTLFRFTALVLNLHSTTIQHIEGDSLFTLEAVKQSIALNIQAGVEKRFELAKNLTLIAGIDAGFIYSSTKTPVATNLNSYQDRNIAPEICLVGGISYQIIPHLLVSLEFIPSFYYTFTTEKEIYYNQKYSGTNKFQTFDISASTQNIQLTLTYRISKIVLYKW